MTVHDINHARTKRDRNSVTMEFREPVDQGPGTNVTCTIPRSMFWIVAKQMFWCAVKRDDLALRWWIRARLKFEPVRYP